MFTGIITAVGRIEQVRDHETGNSDAGKRITIRVPGFLRHNTRLGDSIAVNGACMTVVEMGADWFSIDVSRESLSKTSGLDETAAEVNLEHAMRMGDSLDGHMVLGHVDGVGKVALFDEVGESWHLAIDVPAALARYMAYKGSVTVNGVSLTVNRVDDQPDGGCTIHINLIPHTLKLTNLGGLAAGSAVNLEVDTIARYVDRLATWSAGQGGANRTN